MLSHDISHQDETNMPATQNEDLQPRIGFLEGPISRQTNDDQRGITPRHEVAGETLMPTVDISTPAGSAAKPLAENARRMQSDLDDYLGSRRPQNIGGEQGTSKDDRKDEHGGASVASPSMRSVAQQNEKLVDLPFCFLISPSD